MWNNLIGEHIRRSNRNLLVTNAIVLLILGSIFVGTLRYWYNFALGPFPMERAALLDTEDSGALRRYFVTINGDEAINTEFQEVSQEVDKYTRKVKSETVTANYVALVVDDRLLLVKEDEVSTETQLTGALVPIPADVQSEFIDAVIKDEPDLEGVFMPMLLDTSGFRTPGYWGLGIGLPLVLLALWNIIKGVRRSTAFEAHPVARALARFGQPDQVAAAIAAEVQNDPHGVKVGPIQITPSWLLRSTAYSLNVVHLSEIVWAYQKVTQHSYNFVPTGKTYAVVLKQRNGKALEMSIKKKAVEPVMEAIHSRAPWAIIGFSSELERAWNKERPVLIQAIDERRQQILGQSAAPIPPAPAQMVS